MRHIAASQHTFDGWVTGKAFYGRYDDVEPVSLRHWTQRIHEVALEGCPQRDMTGKESGAGPGTGAG